LKGNPKRIGRGKTKMYKVREIENTQGFEKKRFKEFELKHTRKAKRPKMRWLQA